MCYGSARYAGGRFLTQLVTFKAHTWHPDMYRTREAWSIIQRLGRSVDARALFDSVVTNPSTSGTPPSVSFWTSQQQWLHECGASWQEGGAVQVQGKRILDLATSSNLWKHGVRHMLRVHTFLKAADMNR
eukprot:3100321-Amphidinium_carterae.1